MKRTIKIHGLLRVGTNYLQKLLHKNFFVDCLGPIERGWKHGPCKYDAKGYFLFLLKNPYAWLVSFRNWEVIHNRSTSGSLKDFIVSPLTHSQLKTAWEAETPVDAWNKAVAGWLPHREKQNALFLRYEDLLENFNEELSSIATHFDLQSKTTEYTNVPTRADDWETPKPRKPLEIEYYQTEKYMEEFEDLTLEILREKLDPALLAKFGYKLH